MRPQDKHATNTAPTKPLTPSMSSSFRTSRSPLTPKLAGYNATQQARKHGRTESLIPEPATPPGAHSSLSNAYTTPRTSSRKSRWDGTTSPSEAPPGAPSNSRTPLISSANSLPNTESILRDGQRSLRGKALQAGGLTYTANSRPGSSCGSSVGSPMFFHADDAKSSISSYEPDTRPTLFVAKSSNSKPFVYANGQTEENINPRDYSRQSGLSNTMLNAPFVPTLAKAPDLPSPRQSLQRSSSFSRDPPTSSERDQRRKSAQSVYMSHDSNHTPSSLSHSTSLHGRSPLSPQSQPQRLHGRSVSTDASQTAHQANPLLMSHSIHTASPMGDRSSLVNSTSPDLSPRVANPKSQLPSIEILHPFPRESSPSRESDNQPPNCVYKMSEMSANARHERKVLDLEISNSSLLAINRALERELRKQTAELRRFRRLSRSGRLSMTPSHRSLSGGGLSIVSETDDGQSPPETPGYLSDSDDNVSSVSNEGSVAHSTTTEHDTQPSARDEKRFLQDLSKHKQLLIDSQKINQSLKRCLGWTENLILEAKKALDYKVKVSDVELGGRVLSPEEIEGEWESGKTLLSPTTELPHLVNPDDSDEFALSDFDDDKETISRRSVEE
ncbi:hypothetical protein VTO42DRAFT_7683 [Malbranchea cinnamomea]